MLWILQNKEFKLTTNLYILTNMTELGGFYGHWKWIWPLNSHIAANLIVSRESASVYSRGYQQARRNADIVCKCLSNLYQIFSHKCVTSFVEWTQQIFLLSGYFEGLGVEVWIGMVSWYPTRTGIPTHPLVEHSLGDKTAVYYALDCCQAVNTGLSKLINRIDWLAR